VWGEQERKRNGGKTKKTRRWTLTCSGVLHPCLPAGREAEGGEVVMRWWVLLAHRPIKSFLDDDDDAGVALRVSCLDATATVDSDEWKAAEAGFKSRCARPLLCLAVWE
jgi:hypothetical protein